MHLAAVAVARAAANVCSSLPASAHTTHSILNPIAKPIAEVLAFFYSLIPNIGVAIILLSVVWMLIISPLTLKSTRSMLAMQRLQPQLKKIQNEHRNDRQAMSQATMDLYKEHNVSPFGSCLPSLLPLPVFFALFRVIDGLSHTVKYRGATCPAPSFLSTNSQIYHTIVAAGGKVNAFGLDLSKDALSSHSSLLAALPYFILLLVMIGTQYLQTVQLMNRNPANADNPQAKMMKYLPIIFGVICIRFPAGVILYYAVSNICRIGQQSAMYRFDPKVRELANKEAIEVEADVKRIERGGKASTPAPAPRSSRFRELLAQAQTEQRERSSRGQGASAPRGQASGGNRPGQPKAGGGPARAGGPAKSGGSTKAGGPVKSSGPAKTGGPAKSGAGRPDSAPRPGSASRPAGAKKAAGATKSGTAPTKAPAKSGGAPRAGSSSGTGGGSGGGSGGAGGGSGGGAGGGSGGKKAGSPSGGGGRPPATAGNSTNGGSLGRASNGGSGSGSGSGVPTPAGTAAGQSPARTGGRTGAQSSRNRRRKGH